MNPLQELMLACSQWIRPYLFKVAFALAATLLIIYGADINRKVKMILKPYPFYARLLFFIGICSFGYGLLTVFLTWCISKIMGWIPNLWLFPAICLMFVLIGFVAERRRHI